MFYSFFVGIKWFQKWWLIIFSFILAIMIYNFAILPLISFFHTTFQHQSPTIVPVSLHFCLKMPLHSNFKILTLLPMPHYWWVLTIVVPLLWVFILHIWQGLFLIFYWLTSVSIILSIFIYLENCIFVTLFIAKSNITLWVYTIVSLSSHMLLYLFCFQVIAIMTSTPMNIGMLTSFLNRVFGPWDRYIKMG